MKIRELWENVSISLPTNDGESREETAAAYFFAKLSRNVHRC